ncbi:MAG: hypothetical protein A2919_02190 [Candidatus Spechtbacteria bacterium RIFCSPLOWO2_01_FULL_43_12]|uniref:HEPN domain-containing protein n=1 Tax=Candidatus Spechtbacteria bacterium RIFCSPLOWO2_01_FULL_43_12 TaxID=1802162 RepID=A0A1G2HEM3_9BACT|nr:MAG: hypothetical protein A2919_02190 [Candidatus Spechtbacteria bacterium RIFCSPLOWO2_01_FULL_43_12]
MIFKKQKFSPQEIENFFKSAKEDFSIAGKNKEPKVIFEFSYDTLIKCALAVCAANGLRITAKTGHHIELIRKLSEFLNNKDVNAIGNEMRMKRNQNLYDAIFMVSEKETKDYLKWIEQILGQVEDYISEAGLR